MRKNFRNLTWLVLISTFLLAACSNGRGSINEEAAPVGEGPVQPEPPPSDPEPPPPDLPPDPPPDPPPLPPPPPEPPEPPTAGAALAGYWTGSVTDEKSGRVREATAFVDQFGELQLTVMDEAEDEFVVYGDICCESRISDELSGARYLDTRKEESELKASLASEMLVGDFEFRDRGYQYSFAPNDAYHQQITLAELAGVYTRTTSPRLGRSENLTLTIQADGALTGSHSNGCNLTGRIFIPEPSRNMIRVDADVSGCGVQDHSSKRWNGDYAGSGLLLRNSPAPDGSGAREDTLLLSLVGPTWLGLWSVGR